MPQYGECTYWDQRYQANAAAFEWYQGYNGLQYVLHQYLPQESRLLQIGVGSSRIQADMVKHGWQSIINIDYSKVAIDHMKELHKDIPQLEYRIADVRDMPEFSNDSFDGLFDKGTLDAILCGESSTKNAVAMLEECNRVLKPGRAFVLVTYGDPASRLGYLESFGWSVQVYCLTKQEVMDEERSSDQKETPMRMLLKGPYPASNLDCMDALSGLEGMHFIYVCRKPEAEAGDLTPEPEDAAAAADEGPASADIAAPMAGEVPATDAA